MRRAYADWTERARRFLRARGLVTFPEGEECLVEPSPPFQRPILAVASYSSPPAFSPSRLGHFFVPFPTDGASPEEVRQRLESNSHAGIPTTAVHEAYPGHHWHFVTMKAHPSPIRRTFGTPYFSEGWALYAEHMMREQGFFEDSRHEINQVEATLFRAARIVVDTSLHAGDMTLEEARRFMEEPPRAGRDRRRRPPRVPRPPRGQRAAPARAGRARARSPGLTPRPVRRAGAAGSVYTGARATQRRRRGASGRRCPVNSGGGGTP
jgi:hypothetical protein